MAPSFIRAAAVSIPVHLGDIEANEREILSVFHILEEKGVQIALFPRLCLTGATLGDLLQRPDCVQAAREALERIARAAKGLAVVGLPVEQHGCVVNAHAVLGSGEILAICAEGEARVFDAGGFTFALGGGEADVILWTSSEPSVSGSHARLLSRLRQPGAVVYACAGLGESTTDQVYDGYTAIFEEGQPLAQGERFSANVTAADIDVERLRYRRKRPLDTAETLGVQVSRTAQLPLLRPLDALPFVPKTPEGLDEVALLQTMGLVSRLRAIRCGQLVVGVSGGLDSTLALLIAVRAFDLMHLPRTGIHALTLPGMGTGVRTRTNADKLMAALGVTAREIAIGPAVEQHFADIGQDPSVHDVTYENSQARERTQILMDYANRVGGIVLGTGDLSEAALGFCTYNGDHMSMYSVNASIPKTLVKALVRHLGDAFGPEVGEICADVADTPISPELLPVTEGELNQRTEDILGDYALHDFFLYHFLDAGAGREKLLWLALQTFPHGEERISRQLSTFLSRFRTQQFKRSCMPDGPQATPFSLSPRTAWRMPSDAAGMR